VEKKRSCDPRKTDQTNLHHVQPEEKKCRREKSRTYRRGYDKRKEVVIRSVEISVMRR
jgi:hypothetical protein